MGLISDKDSNTERNAKIKQKYGFISIGLIISVLFIFLISLCYICSYCDGVLFPTIGWIGLKILYSILLIEMIFLSLIRSSIFVHKNYKVTKIFILIHWIFVGLVFISFIINLVYHLPLTPGYHLGTAIYNALYPIILTLPIHITLFISKETFLSWSGFSKKNSFHFDPQEQKIKRISFIIFSVTYLGVFPTIFLSIFNFFFPSIAFISLYYCWFIFIELIWKRFALKKFKKNN